MRACEDGRCSVPMWANGCPAHGGPEAHDGHLTGPRMGRRSTE